MTAPVESFAGDTLMLTMKITEDWFLLKPDPATKTLVAYMLAYWAERDDVELLAVIILGNHLHVIYRHVTGLGPKFCTMALHWIARIMNQRLGRTTYSFFKREPCRPMRLLTPTDVERQLDYVVTNATQHGLCARAYAWPGLLFGPENVGEKLTFRRPPELRFSKIFDEEVSLVVPAPLHLRDTPVDEVHRKFERRRKAIEADEYTKRNGSFKGVARAMTVPKFSRPAEPRRSEFKPFFTSTDADALADAKRDRALFLESHATRLERFRNGDLTSDWPPGTYRMRQTYNLPP